MDVTAEGSGEWSSSLAFSCSKKVVEVRLRMGIDAIWFDAGYDRWSKTRSVAPVDAKMWRMAWMTGNSVV